MSYFDCPAFRRLTCAGLTLSLITFSLVALATVNGQTHAEFDVRETTISKVHAEMRSGRLNCERLVRTYLTRIQKFDQPTKLNSMIVLNDRAIRRARELDEQFAKTGKLLPLHGIPVIVKDNYDTRELQTTAGSILLKGSVPPDDAFQIRKLKEAGAIVLGKSNMAEWAYSAFFTDSSIAGVTRNPYDLTRVPAGSSGGTAAAVAANLGMVGLGTDTGNSIRGPSSHCCLVGIRPTQGLTSRDGIVPLFLRNDIGGPMCRTVEDCALVLSVIAGFDPNDPVTAKSKGKSFNYRDSLKKDGLVGARIGVFRVLSDTSSADSSIKALFEQAVRDLASKGAVIVDPFDIPDLDARKLNQMQNSLWLDTFGHDIEVYLRTRNAPIKNLNDIISARKYGPFLTSRLASSNRSSVPSRLKNPYSADVEDDPLRAKLLRTVVDAMDKQKLDAFVFPTWNNPPRKVGDLRSPNGNNSYHIPPATGLPAITLPMGFDRFKMPAGLQMIGREFSESTLFRLAYAYEQSTGHRRPPKKFFALKEASANKE